MLFQCGTLDTRQLGFPLGAERNVFRGVGNLLLAFSIWWFPILVKFWLMYEVLSEGKDGMNLGLTQSTNEKLPRCEHVVLVT